MSKTFSASDSASASAAVGYGACSDMDPAPLTLDVLDAMEAGVTSFGAIEAGQGRIVSGRAGHSNFEQSEYTRAFDDDTDDDEGDEGDVRSGPLALRPRYMGTGLRGGFATGGTNCFADCIAATFLILFILVVMGMLFACAQYMFYKIVP